MTKIVKTVDRITDFMPVHEFVEWVAFNVWVTYDNGGGKVWAATQPLAVWIMSKYMKAQDIQAVLGLDVKGYREMIGRAQERVYCGKDDNYHANRIIASINHEVEVRRLTKTGYWSKI